MRRGWRACLGGWGFREGEPVFVEELHEEVGFDVGMVAEGFFDAGSEATFGDFGGGGEVGIFGEEAFDAGSASGDNEVGEVGEFRVLLEEGFDAGSASGDRFEGRLERELDEAVGFGVGEFAKEALDGFAPIEFGMGGVGGREDDGVGVVGEGKFAGVFAALEDDALGLVVGGEEGEAGEGFADGEDGAVGGGGVDNADADAVFKLDECRDAEVFAEAGGEVGGGGEGEEEGEG